jgi:hypothetical protein
MWLCLRASSIVHSSFGVSVGVQRYENGAPLQQASELLGMRALARISSGFVMRLKVTSPSPMVWGATVGEAVCVSAVFCGTDE